MLGIAAMVASQQNQKECREKGFDQLEMLGDAHDWALPRQ
jgi:hypothetical protein